MSDPSFHPHPHDPNDTDEIYLHKRDDEEPFEQDFVSSRAQQNNAQAGAQPSLIPPCPKCQSDRVEPRYRARKTGGAIGAVAGAASGAALALSGAETGTAVGMLAGPAGAVCGAIAGAVIAALIGGSAGCATGSMFGDIVDANVLDGAVCHACGHTFSRHKAST